MTVPAAPAISLSARLGFLYDALSAAAAARAAQRLGVLSRLALGPADAQILSRDCALDESGARLLLSALTALGLVEPTGDGSYRAAVPYLAALPGLDAPWDRLDESIRGDGGLSSTETAAGAAAFYDTVVPFLGHWYAPAAEQVARRLSRPGLQVLDVGAGAAPWSIALAVLDPVCRVTAVDLPAVLQSTRRAAASHGVVAQFSFLPGDVFAVDTGSATYDLVVVGNLCHLFDEARNRRLVTRAFHALRPGGSLAILDVLPNERRDGPPAAVFYALGLRLRTSSGQIYPFSAYAGWLRAAGFDGVERLDLGGSPPISLVTGIRPGQ